jgi:PAS domain S-box-containing protein
MKRFALQRFFGGLGTSRPLAHWGYLASFGVLVVLITDTMTPLGFAHGTLYTPLILVAALSQQKRWVVRITLVSAVMIGLGFWLSAPPVSGFPMAYVIANRGVSLAAVGITGGLMLAVIQALEQIRAAQFALTETDETLQAQQRLLQMATQIGHLGGWVANLAAGTVTWSDEVAYIHDLEPGYAPTVEQAIQFYAPEYRDRISTVFNTCTRQGVPFDEELQIITAQGRRVWVRAIGQPVRNDQGDIVLVQGAFQDITQQKQTEVSLERSEQRFRQLADAMPLIVWTAEPDGTLDYASQALRTYTGVMETAPHPDQTWPQLLHPDDQAPCLDTWTTAVKTGSPYRIEFRLRRYDGAYCWHLTQAVPIRDETGQIVKWYGTATYIHDQKQLEYEARELANRLNNTLESITDAFLTFDCQWRFTFVNRQAEQVLQRQRSELLGQVVWQCFPEAIGSAFDHQYHRAMESGKSVQFREFYAPLKIWMDVRAYPSSEGLAVYFQDVSDRIALEEKLRQSQRLEAIGQLTGGVAHDFNNLLTVILGNAELLTETLATNPRLHPLADMITNAAQRGAELTQRLLAFARRQALEPKVVDINQLMGQMDHLLRRTLGEHIDMEWVRGAGLWPALVDPAQLENALLNLCLNARDAMPQGGRLTLESANTRLDQDYADHHVEVQPGQYVMIGISDTGIGIAPEHLEQVFEPFFTTKDKGKGTGLGLSMVYGFVKQSGGHIKIYSEPGEGTTVKMYLPRCAEPDQDYPTLASPRAEGGSEVILLVEDDAMVRRYGQDQLESLGYTVLTAENGPQALAMIAQPMPIDLLFTDVVMPGGMGGRDLVEAAQRVRPGLKVLYTSGYTENAIVHQGRLDAGVHLLSKPYRRADLARKIRDALADA